MRRRCPDPMKTQEVFVFALQAVDPFFKRKPVVFGKVHDELLIDIETVDAMGHPIFSAKDSSGLIKGLKTASGVAAAVNAGTTILTKSAMLAMVEELKKANCQPKWIVPPDLMEEAEKIMNGEDECLNASLDV